MHPVNKNAFKSETILEAERLQKSGKLAQAETVYRNLLEEDPEHSEALRLLGLLAHQTGHSDQGSKLILQAIKNQPKNLEAHFNLGTIYLELGQATDAVKYFKTALSIDPNSFPCLVNLGNALIAASQFEEAVKQSQIALEIEPDNVEALSNLGQALSKIGKLTEAMDQLRRTVLLRPNDGRLLNNLGFVEQTIGLLDCANETYRQALKVDPNCALAERNLLINSLNLPDQNHGSLFQLHEDFGAKYNQNNIKSDKFVTRNKDINRRLRIGYLSSDFHAHPVGFNILPLLKNHGAEEVEIYIYSENEIADSVSKQFRAIADNWLPTNQQSDAQIAQKIEDDKVDILISLAGRFNSNRPTIVAFRAAPIQISFHDCATSGLSEMDFWLTDDFLHPSNSNELFTEQLYRLPILYQFNPPTDFPLVSTLPAEENGFITFGCFNKPEKINDSVVELWAQILAMVPNSKLFLKYGAYFNDPVLIKYWQDKFTRFDISEDRLIFYGHNTNRQNHLAQYQHIDVALDPFPFNGATTTFEALAMGVPVVALKGHNFISRVAASLLNAVKLNRLSADTHRQYANVAKDLASDIGDLSVLRRSLRERLIQSPLCQGKSYAENMESAYRRMWQLWCSN